MERRRESDRAAESEAPVLKTGVTPNADTLSVAATSKAMPIKPAAESPLVIIARI
jgi:hypothetical protein